MTSLVESEINPTVIDKIARYGWTIKNEEGRFEWVYKSMLYIPAEYQRIENVSRHKVMAITSSWSWIAFGVIIAAERDGKYWVVDGQHRKLAADKRSDIKKLPCLIFNTDGVVEEAIGFLDCNTNRKPLTSVSRFKAQIISRDPIALFVNELFQRLGITCSQSARAGLELKCVGYVMTMATLNRDSCALVMELAASMCSNIPIQEILLRGLYCIAENCEVPITDTRLSNRIKQIGPEELILSAKKAAAYFGFKGDKILGEAMLEAINKALRNRFAMKTSK